MMINECAFDHYHQHLTAIYFYYFLICKKVVFIVGFFAFFLP